MTQTETLAYCAGVIDSDGSIYLGLCTNAKGIKTLREEIQVKQVEPEAVEILKQAFGGWTSYTQRTSNTNIHCGPQRPLYGWRIAYGKACVVLEQLLPYLQIKRKQAELVIEAFALRKSSIVPGKRRLQENTDALLALRDRVRNLNA